MEFQRAIDIMAELRPKNVVITASGIIIWPQLTKYEYSYLFTVPVEALAALARVRLELNSCTGINDIMRCPLTPSHDVAAVVALGQEDTLLNAYKNQYDRTHFVPGYGVRLKIISIIERIRELVGEIPAVENVVQDEHVLLSNPTKFVIPKTSKTYHIPSFNDVYAIAISAVNHRGIKSYGLPLRFSNISDWKWVAANMRQAKEFVEVNKAICWVTYVHYDGTVSMGPTQWDNIIVPSGCTV